jgi:TetR/AcrR family transcriptional regulator
MQTEGKEKTKRQRDPDVAREALLEAGAELFARHGFDGTTVEMIARRARANKAMVSYYFGGKERLYERILISTFSEGAARVEALLEGARPADELLGAFAGMFRELAARRPHFPAMMVREAISGGRHMTERVLPHFLDLFVKVRRIYEQGIEEGTFRAADPVLTHLVVMGSLLFFFASEPMRARLIEDGRLPVAQAPTADAFVRNLHELLVRGLAAPASSPQAKGPEE